MARGLQLVLPTLALVAAGIAAGVAGGGDAGARERGEAVLQRVEQRLLSARTVQLTFSSESSGAVVSRFDGTIAADSSGRVAVEAEGSLRGAPARASLRSDGKSASVGGTDAALQPALVEALLVGLTRMGLLHNLVRLAGGALPDHAEGGARTWVVAVAASPPARVKLDGRALLRVRYTMRLEGQDRGTTTLFLDDRTGLPARCEVSVQFPGGKLMHVVERYGDVVLDGVIPDPTFAPRR